MNSSAKKMSDNESHEENEDIILKLKQNNNIGKKEKIKKSNKSTTLKLEGITENSKIIFYFHRWQAG